MTKYKCERCSYTTNIKTNFENHINRKIPCNPNKPNKNINTDNNLQCKICNEVFSRSDSLKRHIKLLHANIDGNKNNQINGDHNHLTQTHIQTQNNIQTQINNPIIIQPIIVVSYEHHDINDLSLFEQYLAITSRESPYIGILDHLNLNPDKPKYHNINLTNINKSTMDIFNGTDWLKQYIRDAIPTILSSEQIMIKMIYNRFRCFLSNKGENFVKREFYYGFPINPLFRKKRINDIKLHLYNNKSKPKTSSNGSIEIPNNRDHEVFWALSKQFNWDEINDLFTIIDSIKINFDQDIEKINNEFIINKNHFKSVKIPYNKLILRLERFINKHQIICDQNDDKDTNIIDVSTPESSDDEDNNIFYNDISDDSDISHYSFTAADFSDDL